MRKLRFLDCYEVTKEEREMIAKDSLYGVVTPDESSKSSSQKDDRKENNNDGYTPLAVLDANKSDKPESNG